MPRLVRTMPSMNVTPRKLSPGQRALLEIGRLERDTWNAYAECSTEALLEPMAEAACAYGVAFDVLAHHLYGRDRYYMGRTESRRRAEAGQ